MIIPQVSAQEQTTAQETVETQLAAAQAQITTLEQKVVDLQMQLITASKPKVGFRVYSVYLSFLCSYNSKIISHQLRKRPL